MLGLDLSEVKTISDEIPRIPKRAFADLDVNMYDYVDRSSICKLCFLPSPSPDVHTASLVPMFNQPNEVPNFLETIMDRKVCLETAFMNGPSAVQGVVTVLNIFYHKSVTVKWTVNDWTTVTETSCNYVHYNSESNTDKFSFKLVVGSLSVGNRLQFCLKFDCEGEYWDNNGGENYVFQVRSCFRNLGTDGDSRTLIFLIFRCF